MKSISKPLNRMTTLLTLILVFASAVTIPAQEITPHAKAGDLDFSFGIGGKVTDSFMVATEMALQPDGKIILGGFGQTHLARFLTDGTLDQSFGKGGKAAKIIGNVLDIALQPDGKILVAGWDSVNNFFNFAVARYLADGTPDVSFGNGGKVTADFFGVNDEATAIAVQNDGFIVVGGYARKPQLSFHFALMRFAPTGLPDNSFGVGGRIVHTVNTDFAPEMRNESISDLIIQPNGRIVAVGIANARIASVRFLPNGVPDATYGIGGNHILKAISPTYATSALLQPDGRILIGGAVAGNSFDFLLVRLLADGTLDAGFGINGTQVVDFHSRTDHAYGLSLLNDGRILQVGRINNSSNDAFQNRDFGMVCYTKDGDLDTSFGIGGKVETDFFNDYDEALAIALQPGGRILLAGRAVAGTGGFGLARYLFEANNANFDLSILGDPIIAVKRGKKVNIPIVISRFIGFTGNITVSVGATNGLKVKPAKIQSTTGTSLSFTFKAKAVAPLGAQVITLIGKNEAGQEQSTSFTLVVTD